MFTPSCNMGEINRPGLEASTREGRRTDHPLATRSPFRPYVGLWFVTLLALAQPLHSQAQEQKDDLGSKVAELVGKLDSSKASDRQGAQHELIQLGPGVLKLLPERDSKELSAEQVRRLNEVRAALSKESVRTALSASRVDLKAKGLAMLDAV